MDTEVTTEMDGLELDADSKREHAGQSAQRTEKQTLSVKRSVSSESKKRVERETKEGIDCRKLENFSLWYQQVVIKADLIELYDISGCYIFRPWSFAIWEKIVEFFDAEIKKLGVQNAYFPLFVSERRLRTEQEHLEGFAAEVAWVTKSGSSELEEPIAIRPTSETIIYPAMSKWIRSHRDLPLKLNQWSNVVRWEFKHPTPFIRSREFLWQEGHTAYADRSEADREVLEILELYRRIYEELLAVPVIKGIKSDRERFAGGLYTTTVEAFIPANGRAVQGATSHSLGQNFARMFDIYYEGKDSGEKLMPWQNSWGCTTRTIGVAVMVHGDDKGLVLPPRIAPIQIVIVPIITKSASSDVVAVCEAICQRLQRANLRVKFDDRPEKTPGWKFNEWELRGVPLRLEVGPRDVQAGRATIARRDTMEKQSIRVPQLFTFDEEDNLIREIEQLLADIQKNLLDRASAERNARIRCASDWETFMQVVTQRCIALTPWCNRSECEEHVRQQSVQDSLAHRERLATEADPSAAETVLSGAVKTLCMPFASELARLGLTDAHEVEAPAPDKRCFACGMAATRWALWGRSY
jgi:prolyl-tRNA synthetase